MSLTLKWLATLFASLSLFLLNPAQGLAQAPAFRMDVVAVTDTADRHFVDHWRLANAAIMNPGAALRPLHGLRAIENPSSAQHGLIPPQHAHEAVSIETILCANRASGAFQLRCRPANGESASRRIRVTERMCGGSPSFRSWLPPGCDRPYIITIEGASIQLPVLRRVEAEGVQVVQVNEGARAVVPQPSIDPAIAQLQATIEDVARTITELRAAVNPPDRGPNRNALLQELQRSHETNIMLMILLMVGVVLLGGVALYLQRAWHNKQVERLNDAVDNAEQAQRKAERQQQPQQQAEGSSSMQIVSPEAVLNGPVAAAFKRVADALNTVAGEQGNLRQLLRNAHGILLRLEEEARQGLTPEQVDDLVRAATREAETKLAQNQRDLLSVMRTRDEALERIKEYDKAVDSLNERLREAGEAIETADGQQRALQTAADWLQRELDLLVCDNSLLHRIVNEIADGVGTPSSLQALTAVNKQLWEELTELRVFVRDKGIEPPPRPPIEGLVLRRPPTQGANEALPEREATQEFGAAPPKRAQQDAPAPETASPPTPPSAIRVEPAERLPEDMLEEEDDSWASVGSPATPPPAPPAKPTESFFAPGDTTPPPVSGPESLLQEPRQFHIARITLEGMPPGPASAATPQNAEPTIIVDEALAEGSGTRPNPGALRGLTRSEAPPPEALAASMRPDGAPPEHLN